MTLDPNNVPPDLRPVIPFAEKWGISDDYDREETISNASREELAAIASSFDNVDNEVLTGWLTGPESKREHLSQEYVAFTNLTMAIHSAKLKLKKSKQIDDTSTSGRT